MSLREMSPRSRRRWLTAAAVLGVAAFGPGTVELAQLWAARFRLYRQQAALTAEQAALTAEQARLTSDPAYVEGLIRSTFKVAQPGEVVIPLEFDPPASSRRTR